MATIKDVAKEANVAISTVSNVLNNVDVVSKETKEVVMRAIEKLNYTPNLNGRYLKKSKTGFIGLFVTSLEGPFYSELITAMYAECCKYEYGLTIFLNNEKNLEESYQAILGKRVDGAVILNETINEIHIKGFKRVKMPVVFLDREVEGDTVSSVVIDNYTGVRQATQYLLKLGHIKIGYVHGNKDNYDENMRYKGYVETLSENGIELNDDFEIQGYYSEQGTYNAIRAYIASGRELPEAFIAANDQMAIGCIEGLRDEGIEVPRDISIIGFDNIEKSKYYTPAITTIDSSAKEFGRVAIQNLIKIINKEEVENKKIPTKLIIRDSCDLRI